MWLHRVPRNRPVAVCRSVAWDAVAVLVITHDPRGLCVDVSLRRVCHAGMEEIMGAFWSFCCGESGDVQEMVCGEGDFVFRGGGTVERREREL